jgi:glycosyltransferase involved in cell wall biosynthesis
VRVLHVDTERTWRGGEQQLLYLLEGLAGRGLPAVLAAQPGSPVLERARAAGFEGRDLPAKGEADPCAAWRLARLLRRERFDLVHAHTAHGHGIALAARFFLGRRARPKLVVARRVDFSIHRHGLFGLNGLKYRGADRIVAVSAAVRAVLERDGVPADRIVVVRDGISLARFEGAAAPRAAELRRALGALAQEPLVVNVGHLARHKGQRYLIEALPSVRAVIPGVRAAIVGDGPLRADLEAAARRAGVEDALFFAGARPPEEVAAILCAADVFAFPSVEEGLGSSLLDAMAAGAPIAAARAGGIPEIVRDGETGLLVEPADPAALAQAIVRLLLDRPLAARISRAARDWVRANGTAERMVRETIAVYEDVLGGRLRRGSGR